MAFVRPRARILEISTTSGSGPLALAGAADGSYNTFASFMSVGDQTYVTVVEPGVAFWSGIATYSATNQITLTTVEETKGTFGAGTKEVMASPLASTSMFREDIAGAIVTGGTSTAYTVASYRKYPTLAQLDGNIIAFTPHATNAQGAPAVTLNVDGLGAKTLRADPVHELAPGVLIAGTPYTALYNHGAGTFYLHGAFGGPYSTPLGASLDYWGGAAPNSAFALMYGQAISRATYADLFALIGTAYGTGDGSTTFNIPDLRGRVVAGKDDMGGSSAFRLTTSNFGANPGLLGSSGGAETHTLTTAQIPSHQHDVFLKDNQHKHGWSNGAPLTQQGGSNTFTGGGYSFPSTDMNLASSNITIGSVNGTANDNKTAAVGSGSAHNNVQPTIIAHRIMRVL